VTRRISGPGCLRRLTKWFAGMAAARTSTTLDSSGVSEQRRICSSAEASQLMARVQIHQRLYQLRHLPLPTAMCLDSGVLPRRQTEN
jgi:hypothetical protein